MPRYSDRDIDCKVYVGDLPKDVTEKELEKPFSYYGPLKSVWVARNPPGFAFVEYEDHRDAEDAVKSLDGTTICGVRARVEHSSGKIRPKPWARGRDGGGGGGRDRDYGGGGRDYGGGGSRDYGGGRDGGGGGGGSRRRFDPLDRCYQCGERGHYAYDCKNSRSGGGGGSGGRSSRRRSRSRSRSYDRHSDSRSRSRSRKRSRTRSYSRSRSRSRLRNGD